MPIQAALQGDHEGDSPQEAYTCLVVCTGTVGYLEGWGGQRLECSEGSLSTLRVLTIGFYSATFTQ